MLFFVRVKYKCVSILKINCSLNCAEELKLKKKNPMSLSLKNALIGSCSKEIIPLCGGLELGVCLCQMLLFFHAEC